MAPANAVAAETVKAIQEVGQEVGKLVIKLDAVVTDHTKLKLANEQLVKMQGEGLLKFDKKVDLESYHLMCVILHLGTVAKACRHLKLKDSTVREQILSWKKRGGYYASMADLVVWRKGRNGATMVPFNDELFYQQYKEGNSEEIFKGLLDDVLSMTENNREEVCADLANTLRRHISG